MPKVVKTTLFKTDVDAIATKLDALPEKHRTISGREALEILKPKIKALRLRGYSFDDIAAELVKNGIKTSASTVKTAVGAKRSAKQSIAIKKEHPAQSAAESVTINEAI
jgi:hypothetical protein